jgi:hypothetical protein
MRDEDPNKVAAIASARTLPTGPNKAGDSLGHSKEVTVSSKKSVVMDCSNAPRAGQKVSSGTILIHGSEAVIRIYQRNTLRTNTPAALIRL